MIRQAATGVDDPIPAARPRSQAATRSGAISPAPLLEYAMQAILDPSVGDGRCLTIIPPPALEIDARLGPVGGAPGVVPCADDSLRQGHRMPGCPAHHTQDRQERAA